MVETHIRDGTLRRDGGRELGSSRASAVARERAGRQLTLWRVSSLTDSGASSPAEPGDPNPNPIYLLDTAATYVVAKACHNLVLELSKSGSGVWAPFPLSMDQNMEGWTTFYLSKTSKRGLYLTQGKK